MPRDTTHTYYLHMREDMKTCTFGVGSDYVDLAAEVFALLADPTRIRIILSLRDGEMSVKDLADVIPSHHMVEMTRARSCPARQSSKA